MVFVAVSLVVAITYVSSRETVSSVVTCSGVSSWVSGYNTVASLTLSVSPLNITDLIAFALTASTIKISAHHLKNYNLSPNYVLRFLGFVQDFCF